MKIVIIVAHDPNLVIGKDGTLPWHYSEDLKFFKKVTMGSPILMGRVVFEELNEKPLPGRENVILSRSKEYEHVKTFDSIDRALDYLKTHEQIFVIGGGEIYKQLIDQTDELIVTEIKKEHKGDTYLVDYRKDIGTIWREVWRDEHEDFSFIRYQRIRESG